MLLLPFWSATQSAAHFWRIKWEFDALVASGVAGDDRHFGTADPKRFGEQPYHRLVVRSIGRRFGHPDLELLAAVSAGPPAADPGLGRARSDPDGDQSIAACAGGPLPTRLPRFMNSSSGSTANVTIIINLKSSR